ncbi:MAG: relaxase domain-containing protein, partial [Victivallaceae bacterium]|nr:relaxase domain-containing protein [Victivallaceae bacterium]
MFTRKNSIVKVNDHLAHLAHNDFIDPENQNAIRGYWEGPLAERLGIAGEEVNARQLSAIRDGQHPATGELLLKLNTSGLLSLLVTSPKSMGIMSVFDPRLIEAHLAACRNLLRRIMQGEHMFALFTHLYNRDGMVHLHTHCLVPRFTCRDGIYKAIEVPITDRAELTRHDCFLAEEIRQRGYHTVATPKGETFDTAFELECVPRQAIKAASKRGEHMKVINASVRRRVTGKNSPRRIAGIHTAQFDPMREITAKEVEAEVMAKLDPWRVLLEGEAAKAIRRGSVTVAKATDEDIARETLAVLVSSGQLALPRKNVIAKVLGKLGIANTAEDVTAAWSNSHRFSVHRTRDGKEWLMNREAAQEVFETVHALEKAAKHIPVMAALPGDKVPEKASRVKDSAYPDIRKSAETCAIFGRPLVLDLEEDPPVPSPVVELANCITTVAGRDPLRLGPLTAA